MNELEDQLSASIGETVSARRERDQANQRAAEAWERFDAETKRAVRAEAKLAKLREEYEAASADDYEAACEQITRAQQRAEEAEKQLELAAAELSGAEAQLAALRETLDELRPHLPVAVHTIEARAALRTDTTFRGRPLTDEEQRSGIVSDDTGDEE